VRPLAPQPQPVEAALEQAARVRRVVVRGDVFEVGDRHAVALGDLLEGGGRLGDVGVLTRLREHVLQRLGVGRAVDLLARAAAGHEQREFVARLRRQIERRRVGLRPQPAVDEVLRHAHDVVDVGVERLRRSGRVRPRLDRALDRPELRVGEGEPDVVGLVALSELRQGAEDVVEHGLGLGRHLVAELPQRVGVDPEPAGGGLGLVLRDAATEQVVGAAPLLGERVGPGLADLAEQLRDPADGAALLVEELAG